jgi:hypothetical protein
MAGCRRALLEQANIKENPNNDCESFWGLTDLPTISYPMRSAMISIAQPFVSSKAESFLGDFSISDTYPGALALDLYKGHLPLSFYVPVTRNLGHDPVNWFMPVDGFDPSDQFHQVLKIQPFASGGYEVTVTTQDLGKIASTMDSERKTGIREKGEQKENDVISSQRRAKTNVRLRIKSMGLEALLTLSIRENDSDTYRNVGDWGGLWDKYVKMCKRHGVVFEYVAVLETHKKGNYHLHAAITGRINLKKARRFWYMCLGGRGDEKGCFTPGNIDVSYKFNLTKHKRREGVAKYVSKYISKQTGHVEFNKKRYWSSKHKLPSARRYILRSMQISDVIGELCDFLGLEFSRVADVAYQFSSFRDGKELRGLWFSYDDDIALSPPF